MGGSQEEKGTPPPIVKAMVTLANLRVGMKAMVEKDGEPRKAEILSIQQRKGRTTFYVHYEEFNKRLDEWIPADRIDLSQEVELPPQEKPEKKKAVTIQKAAPQQQPKTDTKKTQKRTRSQADAPATPERSKAGRPPRQTRASGKENQPPGSKPVDEDTPMADADDDMVDVQAASAAATGRVQHDFSREEEIEKLRTSGSMTQNQTEISRVRNLEKIQMGQFEIEPWYFAPYPIEFSELDMVYICEFCLCYFGDVSQFERHREKCTVVHPPGNEIYRDDVVSFFEIDGRRQRTWCRNLCLLSKLFLDHKTLYYDVDPFLFYIMTTRDEYGCHLVGYFSKEKESAENYNVACILTLPQYQRKGFGKLLIDFSYMLSKREGKLGSPEKPLSDLGLLSYRAYWQETVVELLMDGRTESNIEDIANAAAMTTNDVLHTLQNLNMIRTLRNQHVIVLTEAVITQRAKQKAKERIKGVHTLDHEKLIWKPPVFTAASRTWNW